MMGFIRQGKRLLVQFLRWRREKIVYRKAVARLLTGQRFDLYISHDSHGLQAGSELAARDGAPLLYDMVEIPHSRGGNQFRETLKVIIDLEEKVQRKVIEGQVDHIITIDAGFKKYIEDYYETPPPYVVHNTRLFVPPPNDKRLREALGLPPEQKIVLYLNSLYPGQGLERLVEALPLIDPLIHVAMLGPVMEPNYDDSIRQLAQTLGVADRCHILAPVPTSDVVPYASGADMGIIPRQNTNLTSFHGIPNRLFELVMARLPIACSRLPAIKAMVEMHDVGLVFDETDPQDIARAIQEILQASNHARFKHNVLKAAETLNWETDGAVVQQAALAALAMPQQTGPSGEPR